jgi:uncharacterized protein (DUF2147 family)
MKNMLAFALLVGAPLLPAHANESDSFLGTWRNPRNSVHVKTYPCAGKLCGEVIWASDKQQEDARKAGTPRLVGKQLFSDFALEGKIRRGKLFVPKQGRTFDGTVTIVDADTMEVRGCALGGLICKTQTWTRL